ncbi:MAG: exodeoxyribonuclease VII small subunit [Firmicutes bacterium]|nr:exodeoxyribonuclease VII small subunit [Bacillota bacterium]
MAEMTFEQAFARLEEITRQMEDGSLPLAKIADLYKEGVKLGAFCRKTLDLTEKELQVLGAGAGVPEKGTSDAQS